MAPLNMYERIRFNHKTDVDHDLLCVMDVKNIICNRIYAKVFGIGYLKRDHYRYMYWCIGYLYIDSDKQTIALLAIREMMAVYSNKKKSLVVYFCRLINDE